MALADLEGRLTYVNPAFLALWGFRDVAEVLGRQAAGDFWVDTEQAGAVVAALEAHGFWQGELMARTASGSPLPMRLTGQMLRDAQGNPEIMLGTFVDISAEHASRVQREAQSRFTEMLLDGAGVLIVALDETGRFIRFNAECERLTGWRADEVLGRFPWETVLPPDVAESVREGAFDAVMSSARELGQSSGYTNEWVCRSGQRRMIEWTNRVLFDPERQRRIMIAIGVDATARHEAEQARAKTEVQLRAAQAIARLGSWELDLATGKLEWSDEIFRNFEIDPKRFVASYAAFLEAVHPDDRAKVDSAYTGSLASREPYCIEHRLRMPDGRIKWVEERCETDYAVDGTPLRSRGTVQDITERRAREGELQRYRYLVEQAPVEVWLTDEASCVLYANRAAASSLGLTPDQLRGRNLAEIDAGGDASIRRAHDAIDSHRLTDNGPQAFRVKHRASDGRLIPKEIHATVLEIDGSLNVISFARDITEELRAQQALADSAALMRATLDSYPGWVACVDRDMRYVYVNSQFRQMVELEDAEIIGRTADAVLGEQGSQERWVIHRRLLAGESSISV